MKRKASISEAEQAKRSGAKRSGAEQSGAEGSEAKRSGEEKREETYDTNTRKYECSKIYPRRQKSFKAAILRTRFPFIC